MQCVNHRGTHTAAPPIYESHLYINTGPWCNFGCVKVVFRMPPLSGVTWQGQRRVPWAIIGGFGSELLRADQFLRESSLF